MRVRSGNIGCTCLAKILKLRGSSLGGVEIFTWLLSLVHLHLATEAQFYSHNSSQLRTPVTDVCRKNGKSSQVGVVGKGKLLAEQFLTWLLFG